MQCETVKGKTDISRRVGCSVPRDEVVTPSVWKLTCSQFTDRAKARYYIIPALSQSASSKPYEDQDEFFCVQLVLLLNFIPRWRRGLSKKIKLFKNTNKIHRQRSSWRTSQHRFAAALHASVQWGGLPLTYNLVQAAAGRVSALDTALSMLGWSGYTQGSAYCPC